MYTDTHWTGMRAAREVGRSGATVTRDTSSTSLVLLDKLTVCMALYVLRIYIGQVTTCLRVQVVITAAGGDGRPTYSLAS